MRGKREGKGNGNIDTDKLQTKTSEIHAHKIIEKQEAARHSASDTAV